MAVPLFGLALAPLLDSVAFAAPVLPTGGQVVAGAAVVGAPSGSNLTISQSSDRAIVDWSGFSIGQGGSVRFDNGAGATLNRVTGASVSAIDGRLSASGSVYLLNPNGVIVGKDGVVDVGGRFVASTLDLTNDQFLAGGDLAFSGTSKAAVVNYGKIGALGGDVALIAAKVDNEGSITASNGSVGLAAGYQVLLRDRALDDGQFLVRVGGADTSAANAGTIAAVEVELRAQGGNIYALAGNTQGVISATGVEARGGRVFLTADGGTTQVEGTISARNDAGAGGLIVASGGSVSLGSTARLDASGTVGGTVLVGGDAHGGRDPATQLVSTPVETAQTASVDQGAVLAADGSSGDGGHVVAWSEGTTDFRGFISARGSGDGAGGWAEVSSHGVLNFDGLADLMGAGDQAGTLLLDPRNVTISSGTTSNGTLTATTFTPTGDNSVLNASSLLTNLATNNVQVTTGGTGSQAGDITVAAPLSWSSNRKLTLAAAHDIIINAPISPGSGAGSGLTLNSNNSIDLNAQITMGAVGAATLQFLSEMDFKHGALVFQSASSGSLSINGQDYTLVDSKAGLQGMALSGEFYALAKPVTFTGTDSAAIVAGGATPFTSTFEGLGNTISGLAISTSATNANIGLFGEVGSGGVVRDVALTGVNIQDTGASGNFTGALVGWLNGGQVIGSSVSGTVLGGAFGSVGGLVGQISLSAQIQSSSSSANVTGSGDGANVGGLAGKLEFNASPPQVTQSYATGAVSDGGHPNNNLGGLVGNNGGLISNSYATGAVTSTHVSDGVNFAYAGGLVGWNAYSVTDSYARGAVTVAGTGSYAGGLVGFNDDPGGAPNTAIATSYASGAVSGAAAGHAGGLIGLNETGSFITNTNNYFDSTVNSGLSGAGTDADGDAAAAARTTAELKGGTLPTGFSSSVWRAPNGSYPVLIWQRFNLTVGLTGTVSKAYDQTTAATLAAGNYSLGGLLTGDSVTVANTSGTYDTKNVGIGKTVSVSELTITGADAGYYDLTSFSASGAVGTITAASVTASLTGTVSKAYDGNTTATLAAGNYSISGVISGDTVTVATTSGTYDTKNVGTGKTVSVTGMTLGGADGGNYTLTSADASGAVGEITKAALTITANDDSKTYDAVAYSGGNDVTGTGFASGESVSDLSGTVSYGGTSQGARNAGTYLITPSGLSSSNYDIAFANGTLTIDKRPFTITAASDTKVYNGTTSSSGAPTHPALQGADTISGLTQAFANKNVGTNKTISVTGYSISDQNSGNNYDVTTVDDTTGVITAAPLTITAQTNTKTYDTDTSAAATPTVSGLQGSDTVTGLAETYDTATAGTGKTLSVGAYTVNDGNGGNNYTVSTVDDTTGVIDKAPLTVTANDDSKTYDAVAYSGGNGVGFSGFVGGEDSAVLGGTLSFGGTSQGARNAGTYVITPSGYTSSNYDIAFANGTLTIDKRPFTITAASDTKVYDGTTSSSGAPTHPALQGADTISGLTQAFANKNVGTNKTISVTGYSISDQNSGNNYDVTTVDDTTGVITAAPLTITAQTNTKTYDGTTSAAATPTVSGLQPGDTVTGLAEVYDTATAGTGKTLSVGAYTVNDGNGGNNYSVSTVDDTTGVIDQLALTASLTGAVSKVYDQTTTATLSAGNYSLPGAIGGDDVSLNNPASGTYDTKTVGTGKTVSVSGLALSGTDAGNYSLSSTSASGNVGTITAAALTANLTGTVSKTYDANTAATLTSANYSLSGVFPGDSITVLTTGGTYDTKDAGTGKTVTVSSITLGGADGGNYTLASASGAVGEIAPAPLTITANDDSKTYDAMAYSGGNGVIVAGFVGGEGVGDLGGTLSYTGTSQGAVHAGSYVITPAGYTSANYAITFSDGALTIAKKAIVASLTGSTSKIYDGTTTASLTPGNFSFSGVISGDSVGVSTAASGTYDNKTVGTGKIVSVSGLALSGANAGDYALSPTSVSGAIGTITPRALTASLIGAASKVYDGTTDAPLSADNYSLSGGVAGDAVTLTAPGVGTYDTKDVGTGKTVSIAGLLLSGPDGVNYVLSASSLTGPIGVITARPITVTADPASKNSGEADPALTYRITAGSLVAGESLTGAETRDPGEDPGVYGITQGTLAATSNYDLSFVGALFTISGTGIIPTTQPATDRPGFGANGPGSLGSGSALTESVDGGQVGGADGTGGTGGAGGAGGAGGSGGSNGDDGDGAPYPDNRWISVSITFKAS